MTASPPAAPGMPSEEEVARAIAEALRQKRIPDEIWDQMVASFRELEKKFPDYAEGFSGSTDAFRGARSILSLIRPAFEAQPTIAMNYWKSRALSAEAKLAQAVEALTAVGPYVDAIVCYASTISEHDGNRVAKLVGDFLALAEGKE